MNFAMNFLFVLSAVLSGSVAIPDSVKHSQAPGTEIERARQYVVSRLGDEIGATCSIETRSAIVMTNSRSGFVGISGWILRASFRPRPSWDLKCTFIIDNTSQQKYLIIAHEDRRESQLGEIPDCRNHPELCQITIDLAAAVEIGRSRGIAPSDNEYFAALELWGADPGIVWRISSRSIGAKYSRLLVVDATTGEIMVDRENKPCWE